MNKIIFSFIFSKTNVLVLLHVFCCFSSIFENYFLRLLLITFHLLNENFSLKYQNLSWSFLYAIKKNYFWKYILDIEKIFIKDFFVGHPVPLFFKYSNDDLLLWTSFKDNVCI